MFISTKCDRIRSYMCFYMERNGNQRAKEEDEKKEKKEKEEEKLFYVQQ